MAEKKMTYIDAINEALAGRLTEEVCDKLEALIESLAKRNAHKSGKPTKKQVENEALKAEILVKMAEVDEPMTAGAIGELFGLTPQKVAPQLNALADAGKVTKTVVKGKPLYAVA